MPLYLDVPFSDKDEAKALGARWDPDSKQWYAPNKDEYPKFQKWILDSDEDEFVVDNIGSADMDVVEGESGSKPGNKPISLFNSFDSIVVFDVETTGTNPNHDEIIDIALVRVVNKQGEPVIEDEYGALIKLTEGRKLPPFITDLTGITEQQLLEEGISKDMACDNILKMLRNDNTLLVAYNAHFDLSFLYHFLNRHEKASVLRKVKMFDLLTVYKDRHPYPHKLGDAAEMYSIDMSGAHRALNDAKATFNLLCKVSKELDDLEYYINLFGYNPKYGVSGSKISSVKYLPQSYYRDKKLYES